MGIPIKVCGLRSPDNFRGALNMGANTVGLVFHDESPRGVTVPQAQLLAQNYREAQKSSKKHNKKISLLRKYKETTAIYSLVSRQKTHVTESFFNTMIHYFGFRVFDQVIDVIDAIERFDLSKIFYNSDSYLFDNILGEFPIKNFSDINIVNKYIVNNYGNNDDVLFSSGELAIFLELGNFTDSVAPLAALLVDPSDQLLDAVITKIKPSILQFHGSETPEFIKNIRSKSRIPVFKAIGVDSALDLISASEYAKVGATLVIDAKPPKGAKYPGGHGKPFDWSVLKSLDPTVPFLLSGGLNAENVGAALSEVKSYGLNIVGIDVSSGVESSPGVKDTAKIKAFVSATKMANNHLNK